MIKFCDGGSNSKLVISDNREEIAICFGFMIFSDPIFKKSWQNMNDIVWDIT